MPRPPRADPSLVARHTVSIRLTDDEFAALTDRLREQNASAKGSGMPPMVTRSVFLRSVLLRELANPADVEQVPPRIRPTSLGTPTWERLTRRVVPPAPEPPPVVAAPPLPAPVVVPEPPAPAHGVDEVSDEELTDMLLADL